MSGLVSRFFFPGSRFILTMTSWKHGRPFFLLTYYPRFVNPGMQGTVISPGTSIFLSRARSDRHDVRIEVTYIGLKTHLSSVLDRMHRSQMGLDLSLGLQLCLSSIATFSPGIVFFGSEIRYSPRHGSHAPYLGFVELKFSWGCCARCALAVLWML